LFLFFFLAAAHQVFFPSVPLWRTVKLLRLDLVWSGPGLAELSRMFPAVTLLGTVLANITVSFRYCSCAVKLIR
jgi:hypothetical protein